MTTLDTLLGAFLAAALALPATANMTLSDFTEADAAARWRAVNDGVMGGVSKGGPRIADGRLIFSGEISLANNGGFSSTRTRDRRTNLAKYEGLELRLKGDGRKYYVTLRTRATFFGMRVAFWSPIQPAADQWQTVRVPFSSFYPTSFGRKLSRPRLDPSAIRSFGLMLYDKKAGPFRIELDRISAYTKGSEPREAATRDGDLVATAAGAGNFRTLLAAAKAAGLVDALQAKGPLTVFAPSDAAFARLPKGALASLLKPENKARLKQIVASHVLAGDAALADLVTRRQVTSLTGARWSVAVDGGAVRVGNATLAASDIRATNGVIHVIDQVLLPPSRTIAATAAKAGTFRTLLAAAKAAGLDATLAGSGPLTVFAPSDAAFSRLPKGTVAKLLKPESRPALIALLEHHVLDGSVHLDDALRAGSAKTLAGTTLKIGLKDGRLRVQQSTIVRADIACANGLIHVVDAVLLPPAARPAPTTTSVTRHPAAELIELAVERGAPLYNGGHHAACKAVYEVAATALLSIEVPGTSHKELAAALNRARSAKADEGAWILRRALDATYARVAQLR